MEINDIIFRSNNSSIAKWSPGKQVQEHASSKTGNAKRSLSGLFIVAPINSSSRLFAIYVYKKLVIYKSAFFQPLRQPTNHKQIR